MSNSLRDEKTILATSQEISLGEAPGWTGSFARAFPAFTLRNYQLYFVGQFVSNIGTWLQIVGQGLLVYRMTHSAYWVGVVAALGSLPVLFFSLFGGVIVDRYDKKKLLYFTQYAALILAFILGYQTLIHTVSLFSICVLSFLLGIVTALDMPARQAFIVDLVGKKYLASAIALNSGMFNGARVIGPGIAGVLIASFGIGATFMINALSYIASVGSMYFMTVSSHIPQSHPHPLKAIKEGLQYSFKQKTIRDLLLFAGAVSVFGWSYATLLPVITGNNAGLLGYYYASAGLGALLSAVIVSIYAKKVSPMKFILAGNLIFIGALVLFSLTGNNLWRLLLLFLTGFGLLAQFSTITTALQFITPDNLRGRVMSIYTIMFLGLSPLGSYEIGILADFLGSKLAIIINLAVLTGFVLFLFTKRKFINEAYLAAQTKHVSFKD